LNYFKRIEPNFADFNDYQDLMDLAHFYTVRQILRKKIKIKYMCEAILTKIIRRIKKSIHIKWKYKPTYYFEGTDKYDFYLYNVTETSNLYMYGWYQNYRYLLPIRAQLLDDFSFTLRYGENIDGIIHDMKKVNSVAVHVRRGDYIKYGIDICGVKYYQNACNYLKGLYSNLHFFVFSNEIDYVKESFGFLSNCSIINTQYEYPSDYYDLFLMTQANHNIIANSSFSWWAAFLNQNADKIVIVPEKWFPEGFAVTVDKICPPEWIRVPID
jgi:hypothetical protein